MLKFTNTTKTAAQFGNAFFTLSSPEDWESIGDGPTRQAVLDWLAAGNTPEAADPPPPPPPKQFTSLEFLDLFTESEQVGIATAAMQSAQVKLWYDKMLAASHVTLADPRTPAGLLALVGAGLLTDVRRLEITAAMSVDGPAREN